MAQNEIYKRAEKIRKWLPEYLREEFSKKENWGHIFERHVNVSDDRLCERSAHERIDASCFVGNEDRIHEILLQTLLQEEEAISLYLADRDDTDDWEVVGILPDDVEGRLYSCSAGHEWSDGALSCKEFVIILGKEYSSTQTGIFIRSGYPIL